MKKVKQLQCAPVSLQDFLKEYPYEKRNIKDWKAFGNEGGQAKSELMQALDNVQQGLCAYCEIELVKQTDKGPIYDRQIEHFHPKSDMPSTVDWMFEISNLFAACRGGSQSHLFGEDSTFKDNERCLEPYDKNYSCGEAKKDDHLDHIILKPSELPDSPSLFVVSDDGRIGVDEEACRQTGVDITKTLETIKRLNLDCMRLRNARQAVWEKLNDDLAVEWERLGHDATDEDFDTLLAHQAYEMLTFEPNEPLPAFFTTIRSFLGIHAEIVLAQSDQKA
ncbi:MAG TPA: TIGR02646 family protein [Gammaproteobacteria bacterium]|nr:TIGR02646 family protein [Gammaproteobacteria bacterium]